MTVLAVFGSFISYIYSGGGRGRRWVGAAFGPICLQMRDGWGKGGVECMTGFGCRFHCCLSLPLCRDCCSPPLTPAPSPAAAPPLKLKQSGWAGNYALGSSYIALPWWAGQVRTRRLCTAVTGGHSLGVNTLTHTQTITTITTTTPALYRTHTLQAHATANSQQLAACPATRFTTSNARVQRVLPCVPALPPTAGPVWHPVPGRDGAHRALLHRRPGHRHRQRLQVHRGWGPRRAAGCVPVLGGGWWWDVRVVCVWSAAHCAKLAAPAQLPRAMPGLLHHFTPPPLPSPPHFHTRPYPHTHLLQATALWACSRCLLRLAWTRPSGSAWAPSTSRRRAGGTLLCALRALCGVCNVYGVYGCGHAGVHARSSGASSWEHMPRPALGFPTPGSSVTPHPRCRPLAPRLPTLPPTPPPVPPPPSAAWYRRLPGLRAGRAHLRRRAAGPHPAAGKLPPPAAPLPLPSRRPPAPALPSRWLPSVPRTRAVPASHAACSHPSSRFPAPP
jgi:hypothetical protein